MSENEKLDPQNENLDQPTSNQAENEVQEQESVQELKPETNQEEIVEPVSEQKSELSSEDLEETTAQVEAETVTENETVESQNADPIPAEELKETEVVEEAEVVTEETVEPEVAVDSEVKAEESTKSESGEESDEESEGENEEEEHKVDITEMSKEELVDYLEGIVNTTAVQDIKVNVDRLKSQFYKKYRAEVEKLRRDFITEGGDPAEFKYEADPLEERLKQSMGLFKRLKAEYIEAQEKEKLENLAHKYEIIEKIKELINGDESLNKTFHDFKELQNEWHEIGTVPQSEVKNLWDNYHHNVEQFYDYIKINKELRDLDQKKNLEEKIKLCEAAEVLIAEPSVVKAFAKLQKLHEQWREIGPVAPEQKEEIWNRFKAATSTINKNHQDYFQGLKEEQEANLVAKQALVDKAVEIANSEMNKASDWEKGTEELTELQKVWKTIGFATKKENNKVYEDFRNACDDFFNKKREFYKEYKDVQSDNLQMKTELCMKAESIKDSDDWKSTTQELIKLQEEWKKIGPVPKKHSDQIWKRFRAACNAFFERKKDHFKNIDSIHAENLKAKLELIENVKSFEVSENVDETIKMLKDFQSDWMAIGHVPIKQKDKVQADFREAINEKFSAIKVDEAKRNVLMFKQKMENIKQNQSGRKNRHVSTERDKILDRIRKLESDIVVLDNNIGFFAKTKNAEGLINDVKRKIERAKQQIAVEKQKLDVLNKID